MTKAFADIVWPCQSDDITPVFILTINSAMHSVSTKRVMHSEKSYGMSHGSYYKIAMIFRWPGLEFSKTNVTRAFYDPDTFGGFI